MLSSEADQRYGVLLVLRTYWRLWVCYGAAPRFNSRYCGSHDGWLGVKLRAVYCRVEGTCRCCKDTRSAGGDELAINTATGASASVSATAAGVGVVCLVERLKAVF